MTDADVARIHSRIEEWNEILHQHFLQFQGQYNDMTAVIYDTSIIFNEVLDNPEKHGFKDIVSVCDEDDCLWYNGAHPAYGLHRILAVDLERFLRDM